MYAGFLEDNNPFQHYSTQNIEMKGSESHRSETQTQDDQTRGELLQQVAPRPFPTSILHDNQENYTMQHITRETTNQTGKVDADLPLALQCICREPKLFMKLKDSVKYSQ